MTLTGNDLARMRSQMSRAELVLFTGAGFSSGASDRSGRLLPTSDDLKQDLWDLCFPGAPFDPLASLADLYGTALRRRRSSLAEYLERRLTVDPDSLPDYYRLYFELPWLRSYTLNVDDLERAVASRFALERHPLTIAATPSKDPEQRIKTPQLEVVHLNGVVPGPPEYLTFSEAQYAERIAAQEPWYARCVADITCRPVIFIGTVLRESLLWQHMELRRRRETHGRDLRPTSILVTPDLNLPRQEILRDFRIDWIEGSAESFAREVLPELASEGRRGFIFLGEHLHARGAASIPFVGQLAQEQPNLQTEYLLGEEPQWADLINGRAIERSHDSALWETANNILTGKQQRTALAITGTAGTGKSTALMSLALRFSGNAIPVLWLDKNSEITISRIRNQVRAIKEKLVLAVDDADLYGRDLVGLLRDLVPGSNQLLFVFAVRSNRIDDIASAVEGSGQLTLHEHVVPPLSDDDIDSLIAVLERHNRLGKLTGLGHEQRRQAFRNQAGRQMLVAMIQATSNENFEKKAHDELAQLTGAQRYVYSLVSVATSLREHLLKDEVLLACADSQDDALQALERLSARHLVSALPPTQRYRARHRVIADLVVDKLVELKEVKDVVLGLAWAAASKVNPYVERRERPAPFLARLINHDLLRRWIGVTESRDIYVGLETILSWDYHYWLQRGSLEVEAGDIRMAENFLGAAYSFGKGDYRVQTAYAYMLIRKAWEAPAEVHAVELLNDGVGLLEEVIESWGHVSSYPFHVLGSQGLAWAHRASLTRDERRALLQSLIATLDLGVKHHPRQKDLLRLRDDLRREELLTVAVVGGQRIGAT